MNKSTLAIILSSFVVFGCSSYKENVSRAPANMEVNKVCVLHNVGKTSSSYLEDLLSESLINKLIKNEVVLSKEDAAQKGCSHLIQYSARGTATSVSKLRLSNAIVSQTGSLTRVADIRVKGKLNYSEATTKSKVDHYVSQLIGH